MAILSKILFMVSSAGARPLFPEPLGCLGIYITYSLFRFKSVRSAVSPFSLCMCVQNVIMQGGWVKVVATQIGRVSSISREVLQQHKVADVLLWLAETFRKQVHEFVVQQAASNFELKLLVVGFAGGRAG